VAEPFKAAGHPFEGHHDGRRMVIFEFPSMDAIHAFCARIVIDASTDSEWWPAALKGSATR